MNPNHPPAPDDASAEIPALIETLLETERRLDELTAGELDTVAGRDGRVFLLRRAQERLRFNEASKQAAILNALPAHIALLDAQGLIVSVNEAWRRFASSNDLSCPADAIGVNYLGVCDSATGHYSSEAPRVAEGIRAVLGGTEKTFSIEYPCHSPTEMRWFQLTVTPLADERRNGGVVMHVNITARKLAEEALRKNTALVNGIFSAAPMGIGMGAGRTLIEANEFLCRMVGYSHAELVGKAGRFLYPSDEEYESMGREYRQLKGGAVASVDSRFRCKDGRIIDVAVTAAAMIADNPDAGVVFAVMDITERKRTDEILRMNERIQRNLTEKLQIERSRLLAAQSVAKIGSWETDIATLSVIWSDETHRIHETDPVTFRPTHAAFLAIVHPEDRAAVDHAFRLSLDQEKSYSIEHRLLLRNGRIKCVEERWRVSFDEQKKPVRAIGTCQDITERKRMEGALHLRQTELQALFDLIPARVAFKDTNNVLLRVNRQLAQAAGRPVGEIEGKSALDVFPRESAARFYADDLEVIQTGRPKLGLVLSARTPDGKDAWLQTDRVPVCDPDGKVSGIVVMTQDITERKLSENALRESEERFSSAFEFAPIGMALVAPDGRWLKVNRSLCHLVGYSEAELLARTFQDITYPDDLAADLEFVHQLLAGEIHKYQMEKRYIHARGHTVLISLHVSLVRDSFDRPRYFIAQIQDLTERKKAEAELEKAHRELIETSRLAGMAEVATGILHNVGNVLNSVNVASTCMANSLRKSKSADLARVAGLLRDHAADIGAFLTIDPRGKHVPEYIAQLSVYLKDEQTEVLNELAELQKNVEHIKVIVAVQQNFAKVPGVKESVQITDLVEDAVKMNANALERHGVQVVKEFDEVPRVAVEKHLVLQILVNLVSNAKDAIASSSRDSRRLVLRVSAARNCVRIEVSDSGVGIPPENLTRVFAFGFTTKKKGHGFGLHSSVLAAHEMGGQLSVRSDGIGTGATFMLELPIDSGKKISGRRTAV